MGHGMDFRSSNGSQPGLSQANASAATALDLVGRRLPPIQKEFLEQGCYQVNCLDYDWTLNESKGDL